MQLKTSWPMRSARHDYSENGTHQHHRAGSQDLLTAGRPPAKPAEVAKDRLFTLDEIAQAIAKASRNGKYDKTPAC